jgi:hypothetical protein
MSENYFQNLTNLEVLIKIDQLSENQFRKFNEAMIKTNNDMRMSLFIAKSYPVEE